MKLYKAFLFTIFLIFLSCKNGVQIKKEVILNDYNIVISPDLSNRINMVLHPKPIHDTVLINYLISNSFNILSLNNRRSGQADIYKIDFINRGILSSSTIDPNKMKIDFNQFKNNQLNRANYIRNVLNSDVKKFSNELTQVYNYSLINQTGADIWNYFNETIKSSLVDTSLRQIQENSDIIVNKKNHNVILILTDGYIESANKGKGFRVGDELISRIRKDFNKSGKSNLEEFIKADSSYAIKKTDFNLKDINIFVGELVDRSLDKHGVAKMHPTDFQILKIIWETWLKDSGCSNVQVIQAVNTKQEFYEKFENFLKTL